MVLMVNHLGDQSRAHSCLTTESKLCLDKKRICTGTLVSREKPSRDVGKTLALMSDKYK